MEQYNGSQIVVLEGLEAVRKRPGMYIGSTGTRGLHHLIWEILDNGIDEHLAGFCNQLEITLLKDGGISIADHGRGVPVDIHPTKKIPTARVVYTILHAGGKFGGSVYKVSGGLHGVGASVVNALSTRMIVEIRRDGKIYRDEYEHGGHPCVELENGMLPVVGKCNKSDTGTKVTFYPDPTIFETVEFKAETITKKLKEVAFLNKNLSIVFYDQNTGFKKTYCEEFGIKSFVSYINREASVIHEEPIYIEGKSGDIEVEVALQYTNSFSEQINAYCNRINVVDGGTLVTGFKTALTRVMNQYARELGVLKEKDENFDGKDIRNGLVTIISIKHPDPQFEGQTKTKLGNTDAKSAVEDVFSGEVTRFFDKNVEILKAILENSMRSYTARKASDKARSAVLKQLNDIDTKSKLASCSSKKPEECEVYIVEGDSAGGTVKTARNRRTQAVLPLRGKIINVEKATLEKILVNNEIKSMIASFGCGIGEDFDISKLRYDKIIILTDADVDGAHISTLLLTFFYRFMPELIMEGKIYRGLPPLYRVEYETSEGKKKKKFEYIYNDFELDKFRKNTKHKIIHIQRYKGLGEMDAEQLWETTLNPETRVLAQVSITDTVDADETTTLLMSNNVPPRRAFIMDEAKYAKLDI
ncbi:DNA gyrase/topoisomerase IV subunit B [Lachnoclostridium phytofermentans]|uniref:DNA topoisomerase (ATP-hydrolyzing) n=1 Tax=Lachnoclostridium phytofermentans (strain ATCC 700394 / DSM 18823 / ISDg) TaxID=357809 RepID=A9KS52_LACP7|nr:DNA gyrase subunit B [Lachnoclostridium phytofermentans]ABX40683.1 DNA topoisomerase (ATP-hydrolyzing) [Lachnoclostridium phytofermentans ISDg]